MDEKIEKDFLLFRIGQFISALGDAAAEIALLWWVADKTGSAAKIAAIFSPVLFVKIAMLPVFGPLGDKYSRKVLAIIADVWRGIFSIFLCIIAWKGIFNPNLLVIIFILSTLGSALFQTVSDSIIPQMVESKHLQKAYRYTSFMTSAATIVGGVFGGFITNKFGIKGAFLFDAVSFFIAAIATSLIKLKYAKNVSKSKLNFSVWYKEFKSGAKVMAKIPLLLWVSVMMSSLNFVFAAMTVVLPLLAKQHPQSAWVMGLFKSFLNAGIILASLLVGIIIKKTSNDKSLTYGIAILGIFLFLLGLSNSVVIEISLMFFMGFGLVMISIPISTQFALAIPDEYRSRISSFIGFLAQISNPVGLIVAGWIIKFASVSVILLIYGVLVLLAAFMVRFIPNFINFLRLEHDLACGYFKKTYPQAFD